jgi:O-antigen ligase
MDNHREVPTNSRYVLIFIGLIWLAMIVNNIFSPRVFANDITDILGSESEKDISWYARQLFFLLYMLLSITILLLKRPSQHLANMGKLRLGACIFMGTPIFFSSWLGEVRSFSPYLFCLPIGISVIWNLQPADYGSWVRCAKVVVVAFVYASILAVFINPGWAIDFSYDQSWFALPIRLYGVALLPNQLAPLVSLYFPLSALDRALNPSNGRILPVLNGFLCLVVIFFTQSKTIWLLLAVGAMSAYFYEFLVKHWRKLVFLLLVAVFYTHAVSSAFAVFLENVRNGDVSLTGRTFVWLYTLAHWSDNPIWGYGNALLRGEDRETFASLFHWTPAQAHNQWIHTLGQCGIIGFIGLLLYVFSLTRIAAKLAGPTSRWSIYMIVILVARTLTETPLSATLGTENFLLHLIVFGCLYLGMKHFFGSGCELSGMCGEKVPAPVGSRAAALQ